MEETKPNVTGAAADAKPEGASDTSQINLKVRDSEGNEVQFKIKKTTQLKKLMDAYCTRMGATPGAYRFLFDGHRINAEDTPESLDMGIRYIDESDSILRFKNHLTSRRCIAHVFLREVHALDRDPHKLS